MERERDIINVDSQTNLRRIFYSLIDWHQKRQTWNCTYDGRPITWNITFRANFTNCYSYKTSKGQVSSQLNRLVPVLLQFWPLCREENIVGFIFLKEKKIIILNQNSTYITYMGYLTLKTRQSKEHSHEFS